MLRYCCPCFFNAQIIPKEVEKIVKSETLSSQAFTDALFIVDDSLITIKILKNRITPIFERNLSMQITNATLNGLTHDTWATQGIGWEIIGQHAIVYAGNGKIAYESINDLPPGVRVVLLTDQSMPEMTGTELINASMQITKNQPESIALHTAERQEDIPEIEHALEFIVKNDFEKINRFIEQNCFRKPSLMLTHHSRSNTLDASMPSIT